MRTSGRWWIRTFAFFCRNPGVLTEPPAFTALDTVDLSDPKTKEPRFERVRLVLVRRRGVIDEVWRDMVVLEERVDKFVGSSTRSGT